MRHPDTLPRSLPLTLHHCMSVDGFWWFVERFLILLGKGDEDIVGAQGSLSGFEL